MNRAESIGNGGSVADIVRNFVKSGRILAVYEEPYEPIAKRIGGELKTKGYSVGYARVDNRPIASFKADYILGVGDGAIEEALATDPRRKTILAVKPDIRNFMRARLVPNLGYRAAGKHAPDIRIIDKSLVPTRDERAEILGGISAVYQIALDHKLQGYIANKKILDENLLERLDGVLSGELGYGKLIDAFVLAVRIADNLEADISYSAFIAADVISKDRDMHFGDACLLCSACYLYSAYSLIGSDTGAAFAVEKTGIAESIARMSGIDKFTVLSALGILPADKILNNDYVIREYAEDLKKFISDRFELLANICKTWRRLKTDVGRVVGRSITVKEILKIVSEVSLLGNGYGVMRHYKEMGAV